MDTLVLTLHETTAHAGYGQRGTELRQSCSRLRTPQLNHDSLS